MERSASNLKSIAQLRTLLQGMEQSSGLDCLSHPERDVLCAAQLVVHLEGGLVLSDEVRHNALVEKLSQPTYQRALKSLVNKGFLNLAPGHKKGVYVLS